MSQNGRETKIIKVHTMIMLSLLLFHQVLMPILRTFLSRPGRMTKQTSIGIHIW